MMLVLLFFAVLAIGVMVCDYVIDVMKLKEMQDEGEQNTDNENQRV